MLSLEAFKVEIRPTPEQEILLRRHCQLARYAYNWALSKREDWWRRNKPCDPDNLAKRRREWKDRDRDLSRSDKRALWWKLDLEPTADHLSLLWTETHDNRRNEAGEYWFHGELERSTVTYALDAVDDAFKHYFRRRKAGESKRCGACIKFHRKFPCKHCYGYPRFKKDGERDSFTLQDQSFRAEEKALRLGTKIGMIRTHEPILPVPRSDVAPFRGRWLRGRVLRIVVSRHADKWYASLMIERERADPMPVVGPVVGVDLGLAFAATVSDGRTFEPDRHLDRSLKRLAKLQRQQSRKVVGSKNFESQKMKVARLHKHVADARADHLHRVSHELATTCHTVVAEGYDVRRLAERRGPTRGQVGATDARRRMMTTGLGELRRQLEYKAKWYGSRFEKTAADYPSDQTCNLCGHVNEHMRERTDSRFDCKRCGHTSTRQMNTAELLARLGRGDPFPAAPPPSSEPEDTSSKGRKSRRSRAAHARSDAPGGQGRSHATRSRAEVSPAKGEALRTEEPLRQTQESRGTA